MLSSIEGRTDWGVVGRGAVYGTGFGVTMCTAGVLSGAFQARQFCISWVTSSLHDLCSRGAIVGAYLAYELRPPK